VALRVGFTHATRQQLCIGFIEVLRDLFDDALLTGWCEL
jgi:hypothetical protein